MVTLAAKMDELIRRHINYLKADLKKAKKLPPLERMVALADIFQGIEDLNGVIDEDDIQNDS